MALVLLTLSRAESTVHGTFQGFRVLFRGTQRGAIVLVRNMPGPQLILAGLALVLAGCSGASGLSTASLTGGDASAAAAAAPAAPPPSDPTSRALQVAATSARASRCGFYFDPSKLKASFITAEMAQGASPEELQKIEREYEFARSSVSEKIAEEAGYCDDFRTKEIKRDLNRHLAGDFTPTPKKEESQPGLFAGLMDGDGQEKPFKADEFFDDLGRTPANR